MYVETVTELSSSLRQRRFSATELTRSLLERVDAAQPALNAFVTVAADGAGRAPRAADRRWPPGNAPPLTGVPIAHKDIFCTRASRTTCGSRMLDELRVAI